MQSAEWVDALCAVRPEWLSRRALIHANAIYYVDGARLGTELVEAVFDGRREPWMTAAFAVIERGLVEGGAETQNLIVAGLFEAMQGAAYRRADPPDCLDDWLGPRSREAWADLIEGWIAPGIRTIEKWRRVVLNGTRTHVAMKSPELAFSVDLTQRSTDDVDRILAPIRPLVAVRRAPVAELEKPYARLVAIHPQGPTTIEFGDAMPDGRFARCADRCFVIDFDALLEAWSWLG